MLNRSTLFAVVLAAGVAVPGLGVAPQSWTVNSTAELLKGELDGFAVTIDGRLQVGPSVEKAAGFDDPFVLAQTADSSGVHYFATGSGKIYRLEGRDVSLVFTADEPQIQALVWSGGSLYAGTSPNGKVYRVDPSTGKGSVFFDPEQAFIWSIVPLEDGGFAVATGVEGKLFRVDRSGKGSVWFDAPDVHLRCVTPAGKGRLLAGSSGSGHIYEVTAKGGRALFDSPQPEISAIFYDPATATGWAASAGNVRPAQAPPRSGSGGGDSSKGKGTESPEGRKESGPDSEGSVEVTFSYEEEAVSSSMSTGGGGELYSIASDGFVETVRRFDREIVYGIAAGSAKGKVLVSTGPNGRLYEISGSDLALVASLPEKQVASLAGEGPAVFATTANGGAAYRIGRDRASKAEYRSSVKDLERFSSPGSYLVEGQGLDGKIRMSFRSGNTDAPDDTWSEWSEPKAAASGAIEAPAARYLQWRLSAEKAGEALRVDSVTVTFINRNMRPTIESITVNDPGVVFLAANYPAAPGVIDATNPDEHGIFSSIDSAEDRSSPGKKYFRKAFQTLSWRVRDPNGDELRYRLEIRPLESSNWLRLRDRIDESQFNFDTSQLPDGMYVVRLTASDEKDNPDGALEVIRDDIEIRVDNTAPRVTVSRDGGDAVIKVEDGASPVAKAEYAVDAKQWVRATPVDGLTDSRSETFRLPKAEVEGHFVVFRVMDSHFNVATVNAK